MTKTEIIETKEFITYERCKKILEDITKIDLVKNFCNIKYEFFTSFNMPEQVEKLRKRINRNTLFGKEQSTKVENCVIIKIENESEGTFEGEIDIGKKDLFMMSFINPSNVNFIKNGKCITTLAVPTSCIKVSRNITSNNYKVHFIERKDYITSYKKITKNANSTSILLLFF